MSISAYHMHTTQIDHAYEPLYLVIPGEGYSRQFRIGVCRQGSQTLTLFKGRKSRFDTLFKAQNQGE